MYKIYFKQALYILKSNPLLSLISIIGTALAICMIMVIMILYEVNTADITPEVNRSRSYYVTVIESLNKTTKQRYSYTYLGYTFTKECLYSLTQAETVTATIHGHTSFTSTMDQQQEYMSNVLYTDVTFWSAYQFHFVDGRPYNEAEFASGLRNIVITESLARRMFGTEKAAGKQLKLSYIPYTISGVVKDVSKFADKAYADIWLPFTTMKNIPDWNEGVNGDMQCTIIAKEGVTRKGLQEEIANKMAVFNSKTSQVEAFINEQPMSHAQLWLTGGGTHQAPNMQNTFFRYGFLILMLLLVPALNLSGIILSQMQKRLGELGVRRAFGAKSNHLLWQVITENAVQTLIGGFLGLVLSYLGLYLLRNWLLTTTMGVDSLTGSMFSITVFLYAFLFCMVMNLLSAGIPAWNVSRSKIIDSLNTL